MKKTTPNIDKTKDILPDEFWNGLEPLVDDKEISLATALAIEKNPVSEEKTLEESPTPQILQDESDTKNETKMSKDTTIIPNFTKWKKSPSTRDYYSFLKKGASKDTAQAPVKTEYAALGSRKKEAFRSLAETQLLRENPRKKRATDSFWGNSSDKQQKTTELAAPKDSLSNNSQAKKQ